MVVSVMYLKNKPTSITCQFFLLMFLIKSVHLNNTLTVSLFLKEKSIYF